MIALATVSDTNRVAVVVDLETGEVKDIAGRPEFHDGRVVGRAQCRPFGITWSETEIFVANNKQLLVFDHGFTFLRTASTELQVNTHQLAYRSGFVWSASPWTNSVIAVPSQAGRPAMEFEPMRQKFNMYVPRVSCETDDQFHINSVLWADDSLFIVAHNLGRPSFILSFRTEELLFESIRYDIGSAVHGIARCDGELYWLSTQTQELRSSEGRRIDVSGAGFLRGFAMTNRYFVVALSEHRSRPDRTTGDSWIQVLERENGRVVAERCLGDTGSINDLRLLDEYDYAHYATPLNVAGFAGV